jgi:glycosyltransferase involved in cell wall biosynthesis
MKVTVIIPTFNRAKLVREAIDSVLAQTFRDVEVVVIDDGSTDDTEFALRQYGEAIRYVRQENRGLNAARHRGLEIARGDYIGLLDSDDLWCPFKAALDVSILDAHPRAAFVFSDFYVLKPDGHRDAHGLHRWFKAPPDWDAILGAAREWPLTGIAGTDALGATAVRLHAGDVYHSSLFGPRVLPSASLYRRAMTTGFRLNEQDPYCGDWEFFSQLSHKFEAIYVDEETAINRSHEDEVRLTRADPRRWIVNRLAMINRVWKRDAEFYAANRIDVDTEIASCVGRLLKLHLRAGDADAARAAADSLAELAHVKLPASASFYKHLATVPGAARIVPALDSLRRLMSRA